MISQPKPHTPMYEKNILSNISLHDKNWFKTGGPARHYAEPKTPQSFADSIAFAQHNTIPFFVMGAGANCLISDTGFDGLVIRPRLTTITTTTCPDDTILVTAGAGVSMAHLIEHCLDQDIIGLEEFSGIPGTVGGSVYINLHYFNFLLEHFLITATIFDTLTNTIQTVDNQWLSFGYNYSKLHEKKQFLLDATFKLTKACNAKTAYAKGRSIEIIRHRHARYPHTHTCGSFFRNFHDNEVALMIKNKKMIYAAYYLDKIGVKGTLQAGNALVSYQHANMIVNLGNATSKNIIALARDMQERVYREFNIILQPECQLIGFDEYPLHKKTTLQDASHCSALKASGEK